MGSLNSLPPIGRIGRIGRWLSAGALLLLIVPLGALALETSISLSGPKALILNKAMRETVIEVGNSRVLAQDDDFLADLDSIQSPFLFEQPEESVPADPTQSEPGSEPPEAAPVHYDDATVLEAVAKNFAKQVRGSISRGAVTFLQLRGGTMVRPGTQFPARLPQAQEQTFEVTVESISSEAYVLTLGDARVRMVYDRASADSGRIQFTE